MHTTNSFIHKVIMLCKTNHELYVKHYFMHKANGFIHNTYDFI